MSALQLSLPICEHCIGLGQVSFMGRLVACGCSFAEPAAEIDGPLETSEADAVEIPVPLLTVREPPTVTLAALLDALELCSLIDTAFDGPFPSHPKPSRAWWDTVRPLVKKSRPQLLAAVEAEGYTR